MTRPNGFFAQWGLVVVTPIRRARPLGWPCSPSPPPVCAAAHRSRCPRSAETPRPARPAASDRPTASKTLSRLHDPYALDLCGSTGLGRVCERGGSSRPSVCCLTRVREDSEAYGGSMPELRRIWLGIGRSSRDGRRSLESGWRLPPNELRMSVVGLASEWSVFHVKHRARRKRFAYAISWSARGVDYVIATVPGRPEP